MGLRLRGTKLRGLLPISNGIRSCSLGFGLVRQDDRGLIEKFFGGFVLGIQPVSRAKGPVGRGRVTELPKHVSIKCVQRKKMRPAARGFVERRAGFGKLSKLKVRIGEIVLHLRRARGKLRRAAQRRKSFLGESVLAVESAQRRQFRRIVWIVELFAKFASLRREAVSEFFATGNLQLGQFAAVGFLGLGALVGLVSLFGAALLVIKRGRL